MKRIFAVILLGVCCLWCEAQNNALSKSDQEVFNRAKSYYNTGDYSKAVPLFRRLAKKGDATAQCNLGNHYYNGEGVPQNYKQAVYWYRKAADQELADAQYRLGICYELGRGVKKNGNKALYWYKRALKSGEADDALQLIQGRIVYLEKEGYSASQAGVE